MPSNGHNNGGRTSHQANQQQVAQQATTQVNVNLSLPQEPEEVKDTLNEDALGDKNNFIQWLKRKHPKLYKFLIKVKWSWTVIVLVCSLSLGLYNRFTEQDNVTKDDLTSIVTKYDSQFTDIDNDYVKKSDLTTYYVPKATYDAVLTENSEKDKKLAEKDARIAELEEVLKQEENPSENSEDNTSTK